MSVIQDLSNQVPFDRRRALLRSVIELFVANSGRCDQPKLRMFNDIFMLMAANVGLDGRAELAERLADCPQAPVPIIERLAVDELPVAAPVLVRSAVLSDGTLATIAESGTQGHLLAISSRADLPGIITDILVRRGDAQVLLSVAGNHGARFSKSGLRELRIRLAKRREPSPETATKLSYEAA